MVDLKAFRRKNHISQSDLAKLVGVSQGTISQWESGAVRVPLSALELLAGSGNGWDISDLAVTAAEADPMAALDRRVRSLEDDNRRLLGIVESQQRTIERLVAGSPESAGRASA